MADKYQIDPLLLRSIRRGPFGANTPTPGAGMIGNEYMLGVLERNAPRVMGGKGMSMPGFSPSRPGVGFMPPKFNPNLTEGEQLSPEQDILSGLQSKIIQSSPYLNKPIPGGNIDPQLSLDIKGQNDPQNPLKTRLDNIRDRDRDHNFKYEMARAWQKYNRKQEPEQPVFTGPATVSPLSPDITPRKPLATKQIYGAATKLDQLGQKEDAIKARQYNFQTEKFRDAIKDYQLARTDLRAWVEKNAVPDFDKGMEQLDRINFDLSKENKPPLTFMEFKELSRYQLQDKMRKQGADSFYNELKSNLTSMHSELDRLHKLIEDHSE